MKSFVLPPWEHPGAAWNPRAHTETRLEIGGKKRNFVLKMRDGVIYFKEPSRGQIYTILQLFPSELASDPIGLISAWQREVAAKNYGAYVLKRDYFAGLAVRGHFLLIVQNDGNGWMREHFDAEWFSLPLQEKPRLFNLWDEKELEAQSREVLRDAKASLLQRIVEPAIREAEAPRWSGGSSEELSELIFAVTRLFLAPADLSNPDFTLQFKSHSDFAKGEIESSWLKNACCDANFSAVWETIEHEFRFVGVKWSEGGEQVDLYPRGRNEKIFQAGLEEWGENWRGNWAPQRAGFTLQTPLLAEQSAPEKSDAVLLLRDWLHGKMPDSQMEALLKNALL